MESSATATLTEIFNHLELMGYVIEDQSDGVFLAKHALRPKIGIRTISERMVTFTAIYRLKPGNRDQVMDFVNEGNKGLLFGKIFVVFEADAFCFQAYYFGDYSRERFGGMFDHFLGEIQTHFAIHSAICEEIFDSI